MLELYIYVYFIRVFLIWDNIFEFDEANECVRILHIYIYIYICTLLEYF